MPLANTNSRGHVSEIILIAFWAHRRQAGWCWVICVGYFCRSCSFPCWFKSRCKFFDSLAALHVFFLEEEVWAVVGWNNKRCKFLRVKNGDFLHLATNVKYIEAVCPNAVCFCSKMFGERLERREGCVNWLWTGRRLASFCFGPNYG